MGCGCGESAALGSGARQLPTANRKGKRSDIWQAETITRCDTHTRQITRCLLERLCRRRSDTLGMDQRELAARTGLSAKHINQVIKGTAPISQDTAIRLERVTGVPARMWNNLEANYREQLARLAERDRLNRDLQWLDSIPTRELVRRDAFKDLRDPVALLGEVLRFFGVANVDAWREGWGMPQFAFRRSLAFKGEPGAMAVWLRLCELEAKIRTADLLTRQRFGQRCGASLDDPVQPEVFVPEMIAQCAMVGVAVTLVPDERRTSERCSKMADAG